MIALQEELDWLVYAAYKLLDDIDLPPLDQIEPLSPEHRAFEILLGQAVAAGEQPPHWFEAMQRTPATEIPSTYRGETRRRIQHRIELIQQDANLALLEAPECKRKWEPFDWEKEVQEAAWSWLGDRVEDAQERRGKPSTVRQLAAVLQDDPRFLAVAQIHEQRRDFSLEDLVTRLIEADAVPEHPYHVYTELGLVNRAAWEKTWELQRREDAGEVVGEIPVPPRYSQGSRGKPTHFLRTEYWRLRGELDVPKERFIAFTEVPDRKNGDTLYGWAGWTPLQRVKALLALDEQLEDGGVKLEDRVGLLDSAWRLLPDAAREDADAASRLRAEIRALLHNEGPSPEQLAQWKERFPPPRARRGRATTPRRRRAETTEDTEE